MRITFTVTFHMLLLGLLVAPPGAAAQGARGEAVSRPAPPPGPAPASRSARTATSRPPWDEQEYQLGAGDKLRIEVYGQPQLSQSLQVRPDGKITLPLVGDVTASGITSMELRDTLTESLQEYVNNPVVTVIVTEALSAQVYVIGEVTNPGTQVLTGPVTVLQALAQAGGFKEFADKNDIRILRRNLAGTQTIPFNYKEAIRGRSEPVYLRPGDTLVVP